MILSILRAQFEGFVRNDDADRNFSQKGKVLRGTMDRGPQGSRMPSSKVYSRLIEPCAI